VGRLLVMLDAKVYKGANVYPELLLEEKDKLPQATSSYSFALYTNNKLIDEGGEYSYSYVNIFPGDKLPLNEPYFVDEKDYNHLLLKEANGRLIVVSNKEQVLASFFSYFSYIFIVLFVLILFILTGLLTDDLLNRHKFKAGMLERTSFRTIIQFSFI